MKHINTVKELSDHIVEAEINVKRQEMKLKEGWSTLKGDLRPMNLVKEMISGPRKNKQGISMTGNKNGIMSSGLPMVAVKLVGGFLINRWMAKKSSGILKMGAGMLLTSGVTALLSRFTNRKLSETRSNLQHISNGTVQRPRAV